MKFREKIIKQFTFLTTKYTHFTHFSKGSPNKTSRLVSKKPKNGLINTLKTPVY